MSNKLLVRCGDADNYNEFDDFDDVAEYMTQMGVTHPLHQYIAYGVTSSEFHGNNYISLYWGDKCAQPST